MERIFAPIQGCGRRCPTQPDSCTAEAAIYLIYLIFYILSYIYLYFIFLLYILYILYICENICADPGLWPSMPHTTQLFHCRGRSQSSQNTQTYNNNQKRPPTRKTKKYPIKHSSPSTIQRWDKGCAKSTIQHILHISYFYISCFWYGIPLLRQISVFTSALSLSVLGSVICA